MLTRLRPPLLALIALIALGALVGGCRKKTSLVTGPTGLEPAPVPPLHLNDPAAQAAIRVQDRHTVDLLRMPGVVGTGITADAAGRPAILVLTESAMGTGRLPAMLEGYNVVEIVTGKIHAL